MHSIKVRGLWMDGNRRARGTYKVFFQSNVTVDSPNNDLDRVYEQGLYLKHNFFIFNSPYSIDFSLPANDTSDVSPKGFKVYLELQFKQDNEIISDRWYEINPKSSPAVIDVSTLTPLAESPYPTPDPDPTPRPVDPVELEERIVALELATEDLRSSVPRYQGV